MGFDQSHVDATPVRRVPASQAMESDDGLLRVGVDRDFDAPEGRAHEIKAAQEHAALGHAGQRPPMACDFDTRIRILADQE